MYVIAVFHHYVVNKFCSRESRLHKPGSTILVAVARGLGWNKRQKDEGTTKHQGSRAVTAHHMPGEGQRQRKEKGE